APAGRSEAARSSKTWNGAGTFQRAGRGRAGVDFLASEGRAGPEYCGRVAAQRVDGARVRSGLYAAHHAAGFVEHERAHGILQGQHVRRDRGGEGRISIEADELSGPHFDFQVEAAELRRIAGAIGGIGNSISLRTERRAAWIAARARIYARRRAYFLHAFAD